MIRYLHVRNFALAEDLQVEFESGLNILTGETGAGKSILVGAIAAVLGSRVYTEVVRTGFNKALVEAVFNISALPQLKQLLKEKGIEASDELFLRREIPIKGNTRAFVNDMPVTINTLAEIGDYLVDIHGQHEHQSLLRQETHRFFLDAFGRLQSLLDELSQRFEKVRNLERELQHLMQRQKELNEKYDLYAFQLQEIDKAALIPGEDKKLEDERRILMNVEKLFELSGQLQQIFNGDETRLIDNMGQAEYLLRELSNFSQDLQKLFQEFISAKIVIEETARSIEEFQDRLEFDPRRLEEIEGRLNQINSLKKKYGQSIEEIDAYRKRISKEIHLRENYEFEIEKLEKQYNQALQSYAELALQLSRRRKEVAVEMEKSVRAQLTRLGMPRTRFQVRFRWVEDPSGIFHHHNRRYAADAQGVDQIEFFISPNPGEDFKPLNKIASGGEISRIMLALKSILAEIDRIPTLIFDEIDSGVAGRIAQAVGRSIFQLSRSHQILCITHLPQIASQGQCHFTVEKYVRNGRTFTRVNQLDEEKRVEEIARLLSGEKVTETALESAKQLIAEGSKILI